MDVLTIVKTLLSIKDETQDDLLALYIDIITQSILNHCNIKEVPKELKYVLAQMVVDFYREQQLMPQLEDTEITEDDELSKFEINSISEAGRTVSFDTSKDETKRNLEKLKLLQETAQERVKNIAQLNKYKRPYRIG